MFKNTVIMYGTIITNTVVKQNPVCLFQYIKQPQSKRNKEEEMDWK